ncbi:MAG: hypothetical protein ACLS37_13535, partial [Alistipes sp.]
GYCTGLPQFRGDASVRYTHRKFAFGVSAAVRSVRFWSVMAAQPYSADPAHLEEVPFKVPFTVDLRAFADWHVTPRTTLFAEGRNLANARLYEWPGYPYGAGFTAGVRIDSSGRNCAQPGHGGMSPLGGAWSGKRGCAAGLVVNTYPRVPFMAPNESFS